VSGYTPSWLHQPMGRMSMNTAIRSANPPNQQAPEYNSHRHHMSELSTVAISFFCVPRMTSRMHRPVTTCALTGKSVVSEQRSIWHAFDVAYDHIYSAERANHSVIPLLLVCPPVHSRTPTYASRGRPFVHYLVQT
jgi:hypothetical protein